MPNPSILPGQTKTFTPNTFDYATSPAVGQWGVGAPYNANNVFAGQTKGWSVSAAGYGSITITCPSGAALAAGVLAVISTGLGTDGDGTVVSGPGLLFDVVAPPPPSVGGLAWQAACAGFRLTWAVSGASSVSITGSDGSSYTGLAASGTLTVSPAVTTTYTLSAVNASGTTTQAVTVTPQTQVTPGVTSGLASWFCGRSALPAGAYRVRYARGAYLPPLGIAGPGNGLPASAPGADFAASGFSVNGHGQHWDTGSPGGGFFVTDGVSRTPAPGDRRHYETQGDCEAANAGAAVPWTHGGGPLGVFLGSQPLGPSAAGSPTPTFCLTGPGPSATLTASAPSVDAGQAVTLTWASAPGPSALGATVGIAGTDGSSYVGLASSGSVVVNPQATTAYTLSVDDGLLPAVSSAAVAVIAPTAATNLVATPGCGGAVGLSWVPGLHTGGGGTEILRAASPGGPFAPVGSVGPGVGALTDATPVPGDTCWYRAVSFSGAAGAGPSDTASAASWAAPGAVSGLVAIPGDGRVTLAWRPASGAAFYYVYGADAPGLALGTPVGVVAAPLPGDPSSGQSLSFTDSSLRNDRARYYRVGAANPCLSGPVSAEGSVTPRRADAWACDSGAVVIVPASAMPGGIDDTLIGQANAPGIDDTTVGQADPPGVDGGTF